jgi:hypothetical protein
MNLSLDQPEKMIFVFAGSLNPSENINFEAIGQNCERVKKTAEIFGIPVVTMHEFE